MLEAGRSVMLWSGVLQASNSMDVWVSFFPGINRTERKLDQLPSHNACAELQLCSYMPAWRGQGKLNVLLYCSVSCVTSLYDLLNK